MPEDVFLWNPEGGHEMLDEIPDGLSLGIGKSSVCERSDYFYSKGKVIHHDEPSPLGFSGVPEYVVRGSDLVSVAVRIDHEVARGVVRSAVEAVQDSSDSAFAGSGMVYDDELLGVRPSGSFHGTRECLFEWEHILGGYFLEL